MTLGIVQARLGSTRLPNKALLPIAGRPLIQHVMDRAAQIQGVRFLVLAVPFADVKAFASIKAGWIVMGFRDLADGDVLGRFAKVLDRYPACDTVVRLTGDCPLLSPTISSHVLAFYERHARTGIEYVWNVTAGYEDGTDTEVFSASALRSAHREATTPEDREHVTPWIRRHVTMRTFPVAEPGHPKTSIDTAEDLARVRRLVELAATG